jgi:hypothetical protein
MIFFHSAKNSMLTRPIFIRHDSKLIRKSVCVCAKLFVHEENIRCAKIESWKNKNIDGYYTNTTHKVIILILMNLHATCLPHHPSSVIYSSYHTLLGKLRNCSRFIINHVLMAIPPTDDAKHSNSFH